MTGDLIYKFMWAPIQTRALTLKSRQSASIFKSHQMRHAYNRLFFNIYFILAFLLFWTASTVKCAHKTCNAFYRKSCDHLMRRSSTKRNEHDAMKNTVTPSESQIKWLAYNLVSPYCRRQFWQQTRLWARSQPLRTIHTLKHMCASRAYTAICQAGCL